MDGGGMSVKEYILLARELLDLADGLYEGAISLMEVPYGEILEVAEQIYMGKEAAAFIYDYAKLFNNSLEHQDAKEAALVLRIIARHMMVFAIDREIDSNRNGVQRAYWAYMQYYYNQAKVEEWHATHEVESKKRFQGKGCVYSAIIGNYDDIKEPEYVNPDLDYILFTDNPEATSDVWQIRLIKDREGLDNVRLARKIKIMGHEYLKEYDYSIWVDGKLKIIGDFQEYVQEFSEQEPVLCYNHYVHDCVYKEKDMCIRLNKDNVELMEQQVQRYREEGYPEHNGLVESGIMVRELHDERVIQVMETWWSEVLGGSRRDQLSFNYACWKNDFVYDSTYLHIYNNKYVENMLHK